MNVLEVVGRIMGGLENPYPAYCLLREHAPHLTLPDGMRLFSRHRDIVGVLRDPRFGHLFQERQFLLWGEERINSSRLLQSRLRWFLFMDPPQHNRYRSLLQYVFTSTAIAKRTAIIEQFANAHIDEAIKQTEFDVVSDVALPITIDTIGEFLGIPKADRSRFNEWGIVFEAMPGSRAFDEAEELVKNYEDYFSWLIETKRRSRDDDLISQLIILAENDVIEPDHLLATAFSIFGAGFDTTRHLISNAMYAIMQHPDQLALLQTSPHLMPLAIEESFRYDGSVQFTVRTALEDLEFNGVAFRKGDAVLLCLGSANRDPDAFEKPDSFDVGRQRSQHAAFGGGIHTCLGAALARLEARVALARLLQCATQWELNEKPRWRNGWVFRGLDSLRLRKVLRNET